MTVLVNWMHNTARPAWTFGEARTLGRFVATFPHLGRPRAWNVTGYERDGVVELWGARRPTILYMGTIDPKTPWPGFIPSSRFAPHLTSELARHLVVETLSLAVDHASAPA